MSADTPERDFLRRWSQLKTRARRDQPSAAETSEPRAPGTPANADAQQGDVAKDGAAQAEPPALPPVESLDLQSDYRPFFHPKIEEGVRRAALKKLFSDPHFNVMDGLDIYIDDYSKSDPLPAGMLAQLEQAKKILAWSREDAEERARVEAQNADRVKNDAQSAHDGAGDVAQRADGGAKDVAQRADAGARDVAQTADPQTIAAPLPEAAVLPGSNVPSTRPDGADGGRTQTAAANLPSMPPPAE